MDHWFLRQIGNDLVLNCVTLQGGAWRDMDCWILRQTHNRSVPTYVTIQGNSWTHTDDIDRAFKFSSPESAQRMIRDFADSFPFDLPLAQWEALSIQDVQLAKEAAICRISL